MIFVLRFFLFFFFFRVCVNRKARILPRTWIENDPSRSKTSITRVKRAIEGWGFFVRDSSTSGDVLVVKRRVYINMYMYYLLFTLIVATYFFTFYEFCKPLSRLFDSLDELHSCKKHGTGQYMISWSWKFNLKPSEFLFSNEKVHRHSSLFRSDGAWRLFRRLI